MSGRWNESETWVQQEEFGALFAARAGALRRTAYLLSGDWHKAEDLVQTAFVRTYAAWPRVRDPGALEAYLRRTLLRAHLDETRRRWRGELATEHLPEVADRSAGDRAEGATEDRIVLLAGLATIPPRQRACLVLRYFDDCSVEDTARALDCSEGTVKSNTARGLVALRKALDSTSLESVPPSREDRR